MPRSPVQFQKGQSLAEFTDRYGSEEQCRAALFQARWPQGFECPECGRNHAAAGCAAAMSSNAPVAGIRSR